MPSPSPAERHWHIAPSDALLQFIEKCDGALLLSGPNRDPEDYEVDDIFASRFPVALEDLMIDAGLSRSLGDLDQQTLSPLTAFATDLWHTAGVMMEVPAENLRIVSCDFGVLLLRGPEAVDDLPADDPAPVSHARIVGMFWGHTLILDPQSGLTGLGYGRDLAAARMLLDDGLPTWDLDTPAYSHAGAAAIFSAARIIPELQLELGRAPKREDALSP